MGFPTLIIDNFFDDPDKVVEYANTLEFSSAELGEWPGKRSDEMWMINPELFLYVCNKIYKTFYPDGVEQGFIKMKFQYIEPYEFDNEGWIHQDNTQFGGIIYLTKESEMGTGTSLYKPVRGYFDYPVEAGKNKCNYYLGKEFDKDEYKKTKKELNDSFQETLRVESIYNRLFMFGGNVWHGVPSFGTKPRLTMVFFSQGILDKAPEPLLRGA
tara:strand:- start:86 stop:724 length:639 start_codon:yes stop_codon:yes gene_type:complete